MLSTIIFLHIFLDIYLKTKMANLLIIITNVTKQSKK